MEILQDISTLKEQGLSDEGVVDILRLKGRSVSEVTAHLKDYYGKANATQYQSVPSKRNSMLLGIIVILLGIALMLAWFIFIG